GSGGELLLRGIEDHPGTEGHDGDHHQHPQGVDPGVDAVTVSGHGGSRRISRRRDAEDDPDDETDDPAGDHRDGDRHGHHDPAHAGLPAPHHRGHDRHHQHREAHDHVRDPEQEGHEAAAEGHRPEV